MGSKARAPWSRASRPLLGPPIPPAGSGPPPAVAMTSSPSASRAAACAAGACSAAMAATKAGQSGEGEASPSGRGKGPASSQADRRFSKSAEAAQGSERTAGASGWARPTASQKGAQQRGHAAASHADAPGTIRSRSRAGRAGARASVARWNSAANAAAERQPAGQAPPRRKLAAVWTSPRAPPAVRRSGRCAHSRLPGRCRSQASGSVVASATPSSTSGTPCHSSAPGGAAPAEGDRPRTAQQHATRRRDLSSRRALEAPASPGAAPQRQAGKPRASARRPRPASLPASPGPPPAAQHARASRHSRPDTSGAGGTADHSARRSARRASRAARARQAAATRVWAPARARVAQKLRQDAVVNRAG